MSLRNAETRLQVVFDVEKYLKEAPVELDPKLYTWTEYEDLSDGFIDETLDAYQFGAGMYSWHEWTEASIQVGLDEVFPRIRKKLNGYPKDQTPVAVVAAAGSFKDLLTLALLQDKVKVFGFDITPQMLQAGQEKLTWQHIVEFANILGTLDPTLNSWIDALIDHVRQWETHTDIAFREKIEKDLQERFRKKFLIFQGDLKNQYFASNSVDVVMAVACLQHLKKTELEKVLVQLLTVLKSDGEFYFNLRLDPERIMREQNEGENLKGRVFNDRVLVGNRYYTTFTLSELEQQLEGVIAEYQKLDPHSIIEYELTSVSGHPDDSKPPFVNIYFYKTTQKQDTSIESVS